MVLDDEDLSRIWDKLMTAFVALDDDEITAWLGSDHQNEILKLLDKEISMLEKTRDKMLDDRASLVDHQIQTDKWLNKKG